jgi:hypothetical protein
MEERIVANLSNRRHYSGIDYQEEASHPGSRVRLRHAADRVDTGAENERLKSPTPLDEHLALWSASSIEATPPTSTSSNSPGEVSVASCNLS